MMKLGLDVLLEKVWDALGMVRVYTKRRGERPDFNEPIILTHGRGGIKVYDGIM
jgi:ribosome-interacting GTPase 1